MTDYAGRTREHLLAVEQVVQVGRARLRATKSHQLLLKQRRRAVRRAQWANSRRVAKKRLGQFLVKLYYHRFFWTELQLALVCSTLLVGTLLKLFIDPSEYRAPPSAALISSDVAAAPKTEPESAAPAVTEQPTTEQCRLDAPAQLYPSDAEDGVALRFEPSLSPVSSTQPMESTP